jgi:hypothetical protein
MAVLGSLILIAGLAAIGYLIYQAGVAQGAGLGAEALEFTRPMVRPGGFLTGLLGFLLLIMLFKFTMRLFFFPFFAFGMGGHHFHRRYGWRGKWSERDDLPPFFKEWHERAHESEPEGTANSETV